jgi:hypothetical protein
VRNQGRFYDRFGAVVLLSAPAEVILDRIARRTTHDYGKTAAERRLILHHRATVEPLLRANCTHEPDAGRPLAEIDLPDVSAGVAEARCADPPRPIHRPVQELDSALAEPLAD